MKFYYVLFYLLYRGFRAIEAGFTYQTDEHRTFEVVILITLFPLVNLITVLPAGGEVVLSVFGLVFFFVNYMIFCADRRYQKIITSLIKHPPGVILNILAVSYPIISILAFALMRL